MVEKIKEREMSTMTLKRKQTTLKKSLTPTEENADCYSSRKHFCCGNTLPLPIKVEKRIQISVLISVSIQM